MMSIRDRHHPKSEILLYTTQDGNQRIEVRVENETVWLSQRLIAALFQTTTANVNMHLKHILRHEFVFIVRASPPCLPELLREHFIRGSKF